MDTITFPNSINRICEHDQAIAKRLVEARLHARTLDDFPGQLPTSLEQAYDIQAASVTLWPDDVVAWKIARFPPVDRGKVAAERLFGPAFRSMVRRVEAGSATDAKIHDGGFAVIEAEFVLELGAAVQPGDNRWTIDELSGLVSAAFGGAEIASSPMPGVIELGGMAIIPDLGINVGVIAGPEIEDFASLPADALRVQVSVDDKLVGEARPGSITGDPFEALRQLIEHCGRQGITLPKGALISTGLLTGAHDVTVGSTARVDYGPFGGFDVRFEAFTRT